MRKTDSIPYIRLWHLLILPLSERHLDSALQQDFGNVRIFDFIVVLLSFLFVDMFDTIGTLDRCIF